MKMKTRILLYILASALLATALLHCSPRRTIPGATDQGQEAEKSGILLHHAELGDVIRRGPWGTPDRGVVDYQYFRESQSRDRTNMVAREWLFKSVRIEWALYENGVKHGLQREWFRSGKPKAESPYHHGKMHGMFKEWDQGGSLVACYRLENGSGIRTRYYPNGRLDAEVCITNNLRTGLDLSGHDNGQVRSIVFMANNDPVGIGFDFYKDGSIEYVSFARGPLISFDRNGKLREKAWQWNGRSLSETEYRNIALANPKAPPYFEDAKKYLELFPGQMQRIVMEVHARPRVKIPIELDETEKPITVATRTPDQRP
jgi:antitoxin component YwqK of YwqJK toxin-antitoxin module